LIELRPQASSTPSVKQDLPQLSVGRRGLLEPLALALLTTAIFIGAAFAPPALLDDADSTHAEVAREMAQSGDWVSLQMDGIRYYEKDPLMYWMVATCFELMGPTEFAARLPIAFSALLAVLAVWALGTRMFGGRAGFYSGLVFSTSIGPFLFTRILIPDMLIAGLVTWALFFFVSGLESQRTKPRQYLGFYAACGLAFLAKSMIGVVFPCSIVFLFLLVTRRLDVVKKMRPVAGTAIFLALALPWNLIASLRNEHFFWFHFVNEQVYRYLGKRYPKDYDTVPLALFYSLHALWIFPWIAFLPSAITYLPRRLSGLDRGQRMTLLLVLWIVVIVGFFTFSTRQEYYTLPAIPALAILCGRVLFDLERRWSKNRIVEYTAADEGRLFIGAAKTGQWVLWGIGLASLAASILVLVIIRGISLNGDISSALTRNPQYYALSLGHIFDLTPRSFAALRIPVFGAGLALGIGTTTASIFFRRKEVLASALALAVMMSVLFYWAHSSMKVFEPYLSSKPVAGDIMKTLKLGERIVINGEYESGSTLNFYTHQPVYMLNHRTSNLWFGSYLPGAPFRFFDDESFREAWKENDRIYLDTDASEVDRMKELLSPLAVYEFSSRGNKVVLSNCP
jgi:4-amino-4-deoxy-L-arabinose transferase-like glycosyltransferase